MLHALALVMTTLVEQGSSPAAAEKNQTLAEPGVEAEATEAGPEVPLFEAAPDSVMFGSLEYFQQTEFLGNSLVAWGIALAIAILTFFALLTARRVIRSRAKKMYERRATGIAGLILALVMSTSVTIVLAFSLMLGARGLSLPPAADRINQFIIVLSIAIQLVIWGHAAIHFGLSEFVRRKTETQTADPNLVGSLGVLKFIALVILYSAVLLLALDNIGVDVTAMVAGLGVGGIAIALAVQNILGDLFASLTIVLDKPFEVGDFIIVGSELGTVERIGLKTTRVKSLSGEQLVFANSDLLSSRVRNFKRMQERRVLFVVGVQYDTTPAKVRRAVEIITQAIKNQELARFDRCHFHKFSDSSLDMEAVYWMLRPDYNVWMDTHQAICLEILEKFNAEGLEFAFPTRTVHMFRGDAEADLDTVHGSKEPTRAAIEKGRPGEDRGNGRG